MKKSANKYLGKWRILEMEQWDREFIDLTGEGHIAFEKKTRGELHFGAVDCDLDCRIETVGEQERIEFSFVGVDEGEEVSGRGWAMLDGDRLCGRIRLLGRYDPPNPERNNPSTTVHLLVHELLKNSPGST
ncbi:MAG: hypothetical protein RDU20_01950 [Desulfomonilaceae bacterium]|nr:hypothetical protein [Desulfomonilaceae bacterium]